MAKYILLDTLVAEIDKLVDKGKYHEEYDCAYRDGNNGALYALKGKLNTLDVKEVDLKKEYRDYINCNNGRSMFETAKHFFELGLKVQKENKL